MQAKNSSYKSSLKFDKFPMPCAFFFFKDALHSLQDLFPKLGIKPSVLGFKVLNLNH